MPPLPHTEAESPLPGDGDDGSLFSRLPKDSIKTLLALGCDWLWEQDAQLRFARLSTPFFEYTRLSPNEVLGKTCWELPSGADNLDDEHRAICERHEPFRDFECQLNCPDGHARWISATGVPVFDGRHRFLGYVGLGWNHSRLGGAELRCVEAEERLQEFALMHDGWFWEQDEQLRFSGFWGLSIEKAYIPAARIIGKHRWELPTLGVSDEAMAAHRALIESHRPFRNFEYMFRTTDGSEQWYSVDGVPRFDAEGRFIGYRGVGRNITRLHKLEDTQRRQAQVLSAMRDTALGLMNRQDLETVLQTIVHHAMALADSENGYVYLVNEAENCLELKVSVGQVQRFSGTRLGQRRQTGLHPNLQLRPSRLSRRPGLGPRGQRQFEIEGDQIDLERCLRPQLQAPTRDREPPLDGLDVLVAQKRLPFRAPGRDEGRGDPAARYLSRRRG